MRLTEEVRRNPGNLRAVRLLSKLTNARIEATLAFGERLDMALVEIAPDEPTTPEVEEELRDLQEARELVGAGV
jgi:hypothetical protein